MIKVKLIFVFMFFASALYAQNLKIVSSADVLQLITKHPDVIIVDTRDSLSFVGGHLPNAIHLDAFDPSIENKIALLDKSKEYLVYCRTHNRSEKLCLLMQENGFLSVYQFYEGYLEWENKGYIVEK